MADRGVGPEDCLDVIWPELLVLSVGDTSRLSKVQELVDCTVVIGVSS